MSEEKVKRPIWKKWWVWTIAVVVVIGVITSSSSDQATDTSQTNPPSQPAKKATQEKPAEETAGKLNEPLQVGEVKWVATKAEKLDILKSDNEFTDPAKPGGVFVKVELTAELTGKESGTIDSSQLKIVDSNGRKYKTAQDVNVSMVLSDNDMFLKQINPNVPVSGIAVFDVAKDATELKLEVEDLRLTSKEKGLIDLGI